MSEYVKIQTVYKRNMATKHKTLLEGEYSLPEFEYLAGNEWVFTEKVDGTNIRVMYDGFAMSFGGRTNDAQIPATLLNRLRERFIIERLREVFPDAVDGECVLYGEGYGAKIQKGGGNYRPDQDFVLFDVRVGDWWLQRADVEDVAERLQLEVVPIIGRGTLRQMVEMTKCRFPSMWGAFEAEGIVARPATELRARSGQRIITKIKCRDFAKP